MDKVSDIIFLPCGHIVSCGSCALSLKKCPVCRKDIQGIVKAMFATMANVTGVGQKVIKRKNKIPEGKFLRLKRLHIALFPHLYKLPALKCDSKPLANRLFEGIKNTSLFKGIVHFRKLIRFMSKPASLREKTYLFSL